MKPVFLIFLFIITVACTDAQTYRFRHFTTVDGLSNPQVFNAVQDSSGYIWFGTDYGLNRFDGRNFQIYHKEDGMPGNSITTLLADGDNLVLGCYGFGIALFKNDSFQLLSNSHEARFPIDVKKFRNQYFLASATMGNMGLKFTIQGMDTVRISEKIPLNFKFNFRQFLVTTDNELLMTGEAGIFHWNGQSFESLLPAAEQEPMDAIAEDGQKTIYAGGTGKILLIREDKVIGIIREGLPANRKIHRILADQMGRIWIAVSGIGLYLYDQGTLKFMNPDVGLGRVSINDLFIDRQNNLWICTYGDGIYCISNLQFSNYTTADGLSSNFINCFLPVSQGMLCGTFDGLMLIKEHQIEEIKLPVRSIKAVQSLAWIGEKEVVLSFPSSDTLKSILIYDYRHDLHFYLLAARRLFSDTDGLCLIQRRYKLQHFDPVKNAGTDIVAYPDEELIAINDVKQIDHLYYCATKKGLFIWNGKTFQKINGASGLETNEVFAIANDRNKNIWLATDAGIYCLKNDTILHYTIKDGLPDNNCTSITVDLVHNIWIGTSYGISCFDGKRFENFSTSEGLIGNAVNTIFFDSTGHKLWIGTMSGISVLDFTLPPLHRAKDVPMLINKMKVNNTIYTHKFPSILTSADNTINFQFIALEFQNPKSINYRYRLLGLDSTWHSTATNEVQFANLPPRKYRFEVQAMNNRKNMLSQQASAAFVINPSFWQTSVFRILSFVLLLSVLLGAFRIYLSRDRKRKLAKYLEKQELLEKKLEIISLRQQALNAMMNPHFIFNALGSIQSYMIRNDTASAAHYLTAFARLIRKNLYASKKAFIVLEDELDQIGLYLELEKMRLGEKLNYSIHIADDIACDVTMIPTMIIQPIVENAIIHGIMTKELPGNISIHIKKEGTGIRIMIVDDGIGLKASYSFKNDLQHQSIGLENIAKRLMLMSEKFDEIFSIDIADNFNSTHTTSVNFSFPLFFEEDTVI